VYLQVVSVELAYGNNIVRTYGLLDSGSQSTLIRKDVAKQLELSGQEQNLNISTINDKGKALKVMETSLKVNSIANYNSITIDVAYVVPKENFNSPLSYLPRDFNQNKAFKYIHDLQLCDVFSEDISILIGANANEVNLPLEVRKGSRTQPLAVKTLFGWTLFGGCGKSCEQIQVNLISNPDDVLHNMVQKFWRNESLPDSREASMSIEDKKCLQVMESETKLEGGKYVIPMLWKKDVILPSNRQTADKRLQYCENINVFLHKRYARKTHEVPETSTRSWYLPHHPVLNVNKPGKVRIVFDVASRHNGISLNESLLSGPDLLNSLIGVLIRFRTHRIAVSADIEAMFLQIKVADQDKDSLRFLWKEDVNNDEPPDTYQMQVHIFGAKDSPSIANYAVKTLCKG